MVLAMMETSLEYANLFCIGLLALTNCYFQTESDRAGMLKELAGRLRRQKLLRYSERELEIQRLLMQKGARKKLHGTEKVDDEGRTSGDDEDAPARQRGGGREEVQE